MALVTDSSSERPETAQTGSGAASAQDRPASPDAKLNELLKAADMGDIEAMYSLGLWYGFKDEAKAAEWYGKAAALGHADAQYQLGSRYCLGMGVPCDVEKGYEWYRKAAEQGQKDAMEYVG